VSREIATKVIHPGMVSDPTSIKRFLREARSAAQLTHPGIVTLHEVGHAEDGTYYLVEEFVPGMTLERRLREWVAARLAVSIDDIQAARPSSC